MKNSIPPQFSAAHNSFIKKMNSLTNLQSTSKFNSNYFKVIYFILFLFLGTALNAQVGINSDNSSPNSSAMLDVKSTDKGMLVPRMSTAQRNAISSPATGLLVFDETTVGFWFYNGTTWEDLSAPSIFANTSGVTSNENGIYASDDFVFGSPQLDDDGNSNHDFRMFFDKSKGAFRVGGVAGTNWDTDSLGSYSVAFGYGTKATGNASMAMGYSTNAIGTASTAIGYFTNAIGTASLAMGNLTQATGDASTAFGYNTKATGNYSAAMGFTTQATANASTAFGYGTKATGNYSAAMGFSTQATGDYSTAMGNVTTARSGFETTIGTYNTNYTPNNPTSWDAADRLFAIGNGTAFNAKSDAMVVLKNGNTGFGTSTPDTTMHIVGGLIYEDGNQTAGYIPVSDANGLITWTDPLSISTGSIFANTSGVTSNEDGTYATDDFVFGSPQLDDDGNTDHDKRMFFDKSKGAFRVGSATGTNWNTDSLGSYSVAFGYRTKAIGTYSTAMGELTKATGNNSTAMGDKTEATGKASTAMGIFAQAIGTFSTAMGDFTEATGQASTAMGESTDAIGDASTAMGSGSEATGSYSTAMGLLTKATGDVSTAMGDFTKATGRYSTAMGSRTEAKSRYETALGRYNTDYTPNNPTGWDAADRLFVIGNGTASNAKSDAVVVLKNGNTGFGTSAPDTTLHIVGNIKMVDGTEAAGKVLTSDVNGLATWQTLPSGDNLGNHTATQTLNLNGNYLSGDGGSEGVFVDNSGKVGIGTSAPDTTLHIVGNIKMVDGTEAAGKVLTSDVNGLATWQTLPSGDNLGNHTATQTLNLNGHYLSGDGGSEGVFVNNSGKVGIGTSNPSEALEVEGHTQLTNADPKIVFLDETGTNGDRKSKIQTNMLSELGSSSPSSQKMSFHVSNNTNTGMNQVMTLLGDGNVGIGTSSPDWALHVEDSQVGSEEFIAKIDNKANNNSARNEGLLVRAGHNTYNGEQSSFIQFETPNGNYCGRIAQDGATHVDYRTASDMRLKENLRPTRFGLTDLMEIEVRDYNYIADEPSTVHTGFIAQQLHTAYPPAVGVGGADVNTEPWEVAYGSLTPILVQAVQDQQLLIEELQKELETLKTKANVVQEQQKIIESLQKEKVTINTQLAELQELKLIVNQLKAEINNESISNSNVK